MTSILPDGKHAAKEIGDKIQCVDEKVQVVIDGARGLSTQWLLKHLTSVLSDGKQAKVAAQEASLVIQHVANDIDEIKCS